MKASLPCTSTCSRPAILRCPLVEYFVALSALRRASFDRTTAARAIRSTFFEAPIRPKCVSGGITPIRSHRVGKSRSFRTGEVLGHLKSGSRSSGPLFVAFEEPIFNTMDTSRTCCYASTTLNPVAKGNGTWGGSMPNDTDLSGRRCGSLVPGFDAQPGPDQHLWYFHRHRATRYGLQHGQFASVNLPIPGTALLHCWSVPGDDATGVAL